MAITAENSFVGVADSLKKYNVYTATAVDHKPF